MDGHHVKDLGLVWTRLIDLRVVIADFYLVVGRGRLARKMGSMGFAMETLPVPGFPGTPTLPRPPLQAKVCKAGGQSPRLEMQDR